MSGTKLRFLFLVQGEGRGHMSQALALDEMLTQNGDEIIHTFIGKSSRRNVPDYFVKQISSPVEEIHSPNFRLDGKNKSLRLYHSIFYNARFLKTYYKSLQIIDRAVNKYRPDVLINFYDFLGGFYFKLFRPRISHVVIGHAFLAGHPGFPLAKGRIREQWLFKTNNFVTSMGAAKKLALSLRPLKPFIAGKSIVTPPLLRNKIFRLKTSEEPFILAYMVNDGYAEELLEWHRQHPQTVVHCFWDRKGHHTVYAPHEHLFFHPLDEKDFLNHLARCQGYATTAGFESVAEALYLGKPVLTVPVEGQYEQACNALDGENTGWVTANTKFDLSPLLNFIHKTKGENSDFRIWADQTKDIILHELHNL